MRLGHREALNLWRSIASEAIATNGPDLTARQTALLLTVYLEKSLHTVRSLSLDLGINKPAIVRAIDSLEALGLIQRIKDENDRRNIFVELTKNGEQKLKNMARIISYEVSYSSKMPHINNIANDIIIKANEA